MSYKITNLTAREVFNGMWTPSVEVTVEVENTYYGRAISPAGQSTGSDEAFELRDGGSRFDGKGCQKAVEHIEREIKPLLMGMDATRQSSIDHAMIALDGTNNKHRLGANGIVAVSVAVAKAAASALHLPLYRYLNNHACIMPVPFLSTIDGGHLAFGASSEIQEFNTFPVGAESMAEAIEMSRKLHFTLYDMFVEKYGALSVLTNSCGSFSIPCKSCRETFDYLVTAIEKCGYQDKIVLGMDCAATHFYNKETKLYHFEGKDRPREEMFDFYKQLLADYPIVSMEDPFDENDEEGFIKATREFKGVQIVGDDFFVTNPSILARKMEKGAANAMLWKYNQIGTLTEAFEAAEIAFRNNYAVQTSERSGESEDHVLADLTVALGAGQTKTGTLVRSEHVNKYNRFLEIEQELGDDAIYAGRNFKNGFMNIVS